MTTIKQTDPKVFLPILSITPIFVRDTEESVSNVPHRQLNFTLNTGSTGHYKYEITGNDLTNLEIYSQNVENALDISELPIIKRNSGINQTITAKFKNSRCTTRKLRFNFSDISSPSYKTGPVSNVSDSYAEYSFNRIQEIFSNLTGPEMFDSSGNRAFGSIIPHSAFTGHAYSGGWGPMAGLRFTAITKRHLIGVGHYGYSVGSVVGFKTVDNQMVYRTVIGVWTTNSFDTSIDMSITVLDSDLPESVNIVPIAGDWLNQFQEGGTDTVFTCCPQFYGIILFNNSGHIVPAGKFNSSDISYNNNNLYQLDGIDLHIRDFQVFSEFNPVILTTNPELAYNITGTPFYHNRYYGDSGAPCLVPVKDNKWALAGIVSGQLLKAEKINEAIAKADYHVGVSTGYTVTIATDPTVTTTDPVTGFAYTWPNVIDESSSENGFRWKTRPAGSGDYTIVKTQLTPATGTGIVLTATTYHSDYNIEYDGLVVSYNNVGESSLTYNPFQFWTSPSSIAPSLTAVAFSFSRIDLSWTFEPNPSNGGFIISRGGLEIARVSSNVRTYTDTSLNPNTPYSYAVRPYNNNPPVNNSIRPDSLGVISNTATENTLVSPYIWRFDFDGGEGGYTDWNNTLDSGCSLEYGSAYPVAEGNSLRLDHVTTPSSAIIIPPIFDPTGEAWLYYVGKHNGGAQVLSILGSHIAIWKEFDGTLTVRYDYSSVLAASSPGVGIDNAVFHVWVHYKKSSGSTDGIAQLIISPTSDKPIPDSSNSVTASHNDTADLTEFTLYKIAGGGGSFFAIDHLRSSLSEIGSTPE